METIESIYTITKPFREGILSIPLLLQFLQEEEEEEEKDPNDTHYQYIALSFIKSLHLFVSECSDTEVAIIYGQIQRNNQYWDILFLVGMDHFGKDYALHEVVIIQHPIPSNSFIFPWDTMVRFLKEDDYDGNGYHPIYYSFTQLLDAKWIHAKDEFLFFLQHNTHSPNVQQAMMDQPITYVHLNHSISEMKCFFHATLHKPYPIHFTQLQYV